MKTPISPSPPQLAGLVPAIGAYLCWAIFPLYFAQLRSVHPAEVVVWRVMCTLPFCLVVIAATRQGQALLAALRSPQVVGALALSGLLIGVNWLTYVLAVMEGHVLAASLGYYINPLVNVVAATIFLKERLTVAQWIAVGLATIGVAILAAGALDTLWISMVLALSFAGYGLTRKLAPVESLPGLTIETLVLLVPALGMLVWRIGQPGGIMMGTSTSISLLLALAGPLTGIPLMLFAIATRKLDFSILGFIQFLTPTGLFAMSIFVFGEPLKPVQLICFAFIWAAIGVFCWDILSRRQSQGQRAQAQLSKSEGEA